MVNSRGGGFGAIVGSLLAMKTNPNALRKYFGIFLLFIGIYELIKKE